jgi:hypothetical protein
MVHKVLVVGAGKIGLRHIESLNEISTREKIDIEIHIKDVKNLEEIPNKFSSRYFSVAVLEQNQYIQKSHYKLGIFSTTAQVRSKELHKSLMSNAFDFILLEKPLATSIEDLNEIDNLSFKNNFFVNLPREYMNDFKKLKLRNTSNIKKIIIEGGEINLASNSLHFLRLIEWLSDSRIVNLELNNGFKKIQSRHIGFYEILGSFYGITDTKCYFELNSLNNSEATTIIIEYENGQFYRYLELDSVENSSAITTNLLKLEYQSTLTSKYFLEILNQKSLSLPKFSQVKHLEQITIPLLGSAGFIDDFGRLNIH